jgi:hypothetical protein
LAGNDTVTAGDLDTINGGNGDDTLLLRSISNNTVSVRSVEAIIRGSRNDTVTELAAAPSVYVDLGAGNDRFNFGNFAGTGAFRHVETVIGGNGSQFATFLSAIRHALVDLGSGSDVVSFGNFASSALVRNVETILGGDGAQNLAVASTGALNAYIDLAAGNDTVRLANALSATVTNIETVIGSAGADHLIVNATTGISIDLREPSAVPFDPNVPRDSVEFRGDSTALLENVELILGDRGNQDITLGTPYASNDAGTITTNLIDLGAGYDRVNLGDFATPPDQGAAIIYNVEEIIAGAGDQFVVAANPFDVDLGAGHDILNSGTWETSTCELRTSKRFSLLPSLSNTSTGSPTKPCSWRGRHFRIRSSWISRAGKTNST